MDTYLWTLVLAWVICWGIAIHTVVAPEIGDYLTLEDIGISLAVGMFAPLCVVLTAASWLANNKGRPLIRIRGKKQASLSAEPPSRGDWT